MMMSMKNDDRGFDEPDHGLQWKQEPPALGPNQWINKQIDSNLTETIQTNPSSFLNSTKVSNIREHEESAERALLLKRKELKWKLMQASQFQNRAQLEEMRVEANYNKRKMIKTSALADRLRARYIKVAEAAKIAQTLCKKIEDKLFKQEKFVADEKMQLTKLAMDCRKIGTELYGPDYRLALKSRDNSKEKQRLALLKLEAAKSALRCKMIELGNCKKASINSPARQKYSIHLLKTIDQKKSSILNPISIAKKRKLPLPTRLSSLYNSKNSILRNLASYRLTTRFVGTGIPITDLNYTHNICPNDYICLPDLIGTCTDKSCLYQHKSNYFMSDIEKLADILSYKPSLTGFKRDNELDQAENDNRCRLKLKQYAAKLLAKNSGKTVEMIAQNLVKYVRANKSDIELLTMSRKLPKINHLVRTSLDEVKDVQEMSEKL